MTDFATYRLTYETTPILPRSSPPGRPCRRPSGLTSWAGSALPRGADREAEPPLKPTAGDAEQTGPACSDRCGVAQPARLRAGGHPGDRRDGDQQRATVPSHTRTTMPVVWQPGRAANVLSIAHAVLPVQRVRRRQNRPGHPFQGHNGIILESIATVPGIRFTKRYVATGYAKPPRSCPRYAVVIAAGSAFAQSIAQFTKVGTAAGAACCPVTLLQTLILGQNTPQGCF